MFFFSKCRSTLDEFSVCSLMNSRLSAALMMILFSFGTFWTCQYLRIPVHHQEPTLMLQDDFAIHLFVATSQEICLVPSRLFFFFNSSYQPKELLSTVFLRYFILLARALSAWSWPHSPSRLVMAHNLHGFLVQCGVELCPSWEWLDWQWKTRKHYWP